jgi:hypothetical protein
MQIKRSKTQYLHSTILILVTLFVWVLSSSGGASADMYTDSAHGNDSSGVNRSTATCENWPGGVCSIGSCAHCHDTFDPSTCGVNNFMLFYDDWVTKSDMFCFECHSASTEHQQVTNYPYCVTFGGRAEFYANINKQFTNEYSKPANCGSRHDLSAIHDLMVDDTHNWGFSSDPDPCGACHNPHADQRNHPVAIDGEGKLNTAIRRPSDYKSTDPAGSLWGDDESERMDDYATSVGGTYQAPYYGSSGSGNYEPAGNGVSDGSNLPDYATFCVDCHQYEQYDPERDQVVRAIDWSAERHGGFPSNTCDAGETYEGDPFEGPLRPPYDTYEPNEFNFVLSCLDCHEPHGTKKRLHLIRRMISGEELGADNDPCDEAGDWASICGRCHYLTHSYAPVCTGCHYHGKLCPHPEACIGLPCF